MDNFVIYGAGQTGSNFYKAIKAAGSDIDYFIDRYIQKTELFGKKIYRLDKTPSKNVTVLISVPSGEMNIINELKKVGFTKIVGFMDTLRLFPKILKHFAKLESLWMTENQNKLINDSAIKTFKKLLCDEKSKKLLDRIILFRKTFVPENYILPDNKTQYFPSDLNLFNNIDRLRMIDCGAYNGDTVVSALHQNIEIEYIVSFEPDANNLSAMIDNFQKYLQNSSQTRFIIYPFGIWKETTTLKFNSCGPSSSVLLKKDAKENILSVPVTSIDETMAFASPNYIKMDIEGAEQEGIIGAKHTILSHKPVLAISLYHKPEDLWEIPLLIENISPNKYNMYIRIHAHFCRETVLYCIPKKR